MPLTCQTSSGSVQRLPERPDFCPRYLDAAEVLDLRRVDDTDAVPGFMECDRQAIAVATGGLKAGMHVADPELLQPAQQGLPALAIVSEDLGAAACAPSQRDIELLLGDVDPKPGKTGHFHVLNQFGRGSKAVPAVRQPCTPTVPKNRYSTEKS